MSRERERDRRLRRRPRLIIELPYEGRPEVRVVADTFEDERRLRLWLRSRGALRDVRRRALEQLGELDDEQETT
jgi:hypothetical protein